MEQHYRANTHYFDGVDPVDGKVYLKAKAGQTLVVEGAAAGGGTPGGAEGDVQINFAGEFFGDSVLNMSAGVLKVDNEVTAEKFSYTTKDWEGLGYNTIYRGPKLLPPQDIVPSYPTYRKTGRYVNVSSGANVVAFSCPNPEPDYGSAPNGGVSVWTQSGDNFDEFTSFNILGVYFTDAVDYGCPSLSSNGTKLTVAAYGSNDSKITTYSAFPANTSISVSSNAARLGTNRMLVQTNTAWNIMNWSGSAWTLQQTLHTHSFDTTPYNMVMGNDDNVAFITDTGLQVWRYNGSIWVKMHSNINYITCMSMWGNKLVVCELFKMYTLVDGVKVGVDIAIDNVISVAVNSSYLYTLGDGESVGEFGGQLRTYSNATGDWVQVSMQLIGSYAEHIACNENIFAVGFPNDGGKGRGKIFRIEPTAGLDGLTFFVNTITLDNPSEAVIDNTVKTRFTRDVRVDRDLVVSGAIDCINVTAAKVVTSNLQAVGLVKFDRAEVVGELYAVEIIAALKFQVYGSSTLNGPLQVNGNATCTGVMTAASYVTSSDYRLKKDVTDSEDCLGRINQLRPVDYHWNEDSSDSLPITGFIAHEVQEVYPHAVFGEKDGVEMQGIDQIRLIATLVGAVQELSREVTELRRTRCLCNYV